MRTPKTYMIVAQAHETTTHYYALAMREGKLISAYPGKTWVDMPKVTDFDWHNVTYVTPSDQDPMQSAYVAAVTEVLRQNLSHADSVE